MTATAAQYLLQEAAERILSLEEDAEDAEDEEQAGTSSLCLAPPPISLAVHHSDNRGL